MSTSALVVVALVTAAVMLTDLPRTTLVGTTAALNVKVGAVTADAVVDTADERAANMSRPTDKPAMSCHRVSLLRRCSGIFVGYVSTQTPRTPQPSDWRVTRCG